MVGFRMDCVLVCLGHLGYRVYTVRVCVMPHRHDVAQFVLRKQGELVGVPVIPYPFLCLPPYVLRGYCAVWVLC